MAQIIYTITDEAPASSNKIVSYQLFRSFVEPFGISIETKDISLSGANSYLSFSELSYLKNQVC